MNRATVIFSAFVACILSLTSTGAAADISSAGVKGKWSEGTTWVGGVVPGPLDNATIVDGDTVTYDKISAAVGNLTVGQGTSGVFQFSRVDTTMLTIWGNLEVKAGAIFKVQNRSVTGSLVHRLYLVGNLTNAGAGFDLRAGNSGTTLAVCNIICIGSTNTTITMGPYTSSNNEFNGFMINKSGSARVILRSDMVMAGGSNTEEPGNPYLTLKRGIIETGQYILIHLYTNGTIVTGGSDTSYVLGAMGRGMSNSGTTYRIFQVGDAKGYRPVMLRCATSGLATGHYIRVNALLGNANTGSSTFAGGIDKVSEVRSFKVSYGIAAGAGATSMTLNQFSVSYGLNEGVAAGNLNLRVAVADSNRAIWTGIGPATFPHMTALDSLPTMITSDSIGGRTLQAGGAALYLALGRATGTTENSLKEGTSAVERIDGIPAAYEVMQNYPNPFNPSTTIRYGLPLNSQVTLSVFNTLGQEVVNLVRGEYEAGYHEITFSASGLPSGVYFYRLKAGDFVQTKKLIVLR